MPTSNSIRIDFKCDDSDEIKVKKTWQALFNIFKENRPLILDYGMHDVLDLYEELKYLFFKLRDKQYFLCFVGFSDTGTYLVIEDDDDESGFDDICSGAGMDFYVSLYIHEEFSDIAICEELC